MKKIHLWSGVVLLSTLLLVACDDGGGPAEVEFRIPVEVAAVSTDLVEDLIVTTGTLRAPESVILNAETPGFLFLAREGSGQRLAEGSQVQKGQLIAEITGEDARLAARLESTRRRLEIAEQEMKSRQRLFEEELLAQEDVRRAEAVYEEALHDFDQSERTTEKMKISTPISGVVLELARDENGLPAADGQMVLPGFTVAQIAPIRNLIADIDLVGPELARVRPGQAVRIRHYAFEGISLPGQILRLSPTMNSQTHTFRAEVSVDNSQRLLRPGMFIEASIVVERREDVAVVPRESVTERAGRSVIFVIDGQRAVQRDVSLGLGDDVRVEVTDGVAAGEQIVVRGLETLTDGTRVRVVGAP